MEKKKKNIVIGVTSLLLATLLLLGLTYAYYKTKIVGNTSDKSVSVVSKKLELTYNDGSDGVIGGSAIEPSDTVYTKTFTVTNTGSEKLEYGVYLINVVNTFARKDDIKYTLSCSSNGESCNSKTETTFPSGISELITNEIDASKTHTYTFSFTYKDTGTDQSEDMGKELSAKIQIFASETDGTYIPFEDETLAYNIVSNAKNATNETVFNETVANVGVKSTSSKQIINEKVVKAVNPNISNFVPYYSTVSDGWESNAQSWGDFTKENCESRIGNYFLILSGTDEGSDTYSRYQPYEIKGCEQSDDGNWYPMIEQKILEYVKILSTSQDDTGTSYYYRGLVEDNYVNFAGMCWKIVRINGDGSIKLYLANKGQECSSNMTYNASVGSGIYGYSKNSDGTYKLDYVNSIESGLADQFQKFQTNSLKNYLKYLKPGGWCVSATTLGSNATLKCRNSLIDKFKDDTDMYVATLTADEFIYAGTTHFDYKDDKQNYFYLNYGEDAPTLTCKTGNFDFSDYPTYVPSAYGFDVYNYSGSEGANYIYDYGPFHADTEFDAIPAINLKSGIKISSGNGTLANPYVIS